MSRDHNVIGRNVSKFRYQRGWTQDDLVGKLQLLGCYMTRDILANIETLRGPVTDKQIEFFAEVFCKTAGELFPEKKHFTGRPVGLEMHVPTRQRHSPPSPRRKSSPATDGRK